MHETRGRRDRGTQHREDHHAHASRQAAAALALAGALPAAAAAQAPAQAWPQRPIRMIVPFPAGGGTEFIARIAAKQLSDRLGQQVFVENRGGANGAIGLQALMQSDPDGYTIATCSDTPLVVNPWLYDKLAYAPLRDFVPVATLVRFPGMLAVHPSVPARSVAELIALAKAKPAALSLRLGGSGQFQPSRHGAVFPCDRGEAVARALQGHRSRFARADRGRGADGFQQRADAAAAACKPANWSRWRWPNRSAMPSSLTCPRSPKRCRDLQWRRGSASSCRHGHRRRSWSGSRRRASAIMHDPQVVKQLTDQQVTPMRSAPRSWARSCATISTNGRV